MSSSISRLVSQSGCTFVAPSARRRPPSFAPTISFRLVRIGVAPLQGTRLAPGVARSTLILRLAARVGREMALARRGHLPAGRAPSALPAPPLAVDRDGGEIKDLSVLPHPALGHLPVEPN